MSDRKKENHKIDEIPTTKIARTRVAGATAMKIGAKKIGLLAKKPFLSKESYQNQQEQSEKQIAETIFQGLSHLRGTALKIAQALSLEVGILPEALRKELYKSHYQAPPLNRAIIRRIIKSELGKYPEEVFRKFEADAFAAASLGQVHRAVSHDGRELAVKVQYPGIGDSVTSDLQMVRTLFAPLRQSKYIMASLNEIGERLAEEVNYEIEFKNTKWFFENILYKDVIIPEPIKQFSSTHVITTTFQEGLHITPWLAKNPTQEQRDQIAQVLCDSFMYTTFNKGRFHADPNPGNYLFRDDGKLAIIDFGCIKTVDLNLLSAFKSVFDAHIDGDFERCQIGYRQLGIKDPTTPAFKKFYSEKLHVFGEWVAVPFRAQEFDFGKNTNYCDEVGTILRDMVTSPQLDGFTSEFVMFDRNFYGLYRIFQQLGAKVRFDRKWFSQKEEVN